MLKVTRKVLAQSQNSPDQRQIAISDASNPELKAQFETAGKNRKIRLLLAKRISLWMGIRGLFGIATTTRAKRTKRILINSFHCWRTILMRHSSLFVRLRPISH
ncbi:hypothetical protein ACEUB2_19735 [Aeromonas veronii]